MEPLLALWLSRCKSDVGVYVAVIRGVPTLRALVVTWAAPSTRVTGCPPLRGVPSSEANVTVPSGTPRPGAVAATVAVKVTLSPSITKSGFDDVTVTVVSALPTA
jgi:hypothetical protein